MGVRCGRRGAALAGVLAMATLGTAGLGAAGAAPRHGAAGSKLVVGLATSSIDHLDPSLWYYASTWTIANVTCTTLLVYPDKPGQAGSVLRPGIAELPTSSQGGRVYTFRLRPGVTFSDGRPVTAEDVRYTFERALARSMAGPAQYFFGDIAGAAAYIAGKAKHVAGITVKGATIRFRLTAPSGSFPQRASMKWLCPVPAGTPMKPIEDGSLPSTGPYRISSYQPGRELVLTRNANYSAQVLGRRGMVDEIDMPIGTDPAQALLKVKAGQLDTYLEPLPAASANQALADPSLRGRVFKYPEAGIRYIPLNNDVPPLSNPLVRQAINYAIDRSQIVKVVGGPGVATPTDQILPPTMHGWRDYHAYPNHADLAKARRLMQEAGVTGPVTLKADVGSDDIQLAQVVQQALERIGIKITFHVGPSNVLDPAEDKRSNRIPMRIAQSWTQDYPDPEDFFTPLLDPRQADQPGHKAHFAVRSTIPLFERAFRLTGPARFSAYQRLDQLLMTRYAPWVPLYYPTDVFVVSSRTTGFLFHPVYNRVDLATLGVKS